jgi:hypothetical protein
MALISNVSASSGTTDKFAARLVTEKIKSSQCFTKKKPRRSGAFVFG